MWIKESSFNLEKGVEDFAGGWNFGCRLGGFEKSVTTEPAQLAGIAVLETLRYTVSVHRYK